MKVTSLEEYGLRIMLLLARRGPGEIIALPEFQSLEGLSIPYSAKLLSILKGAGLVKAVRGRKGGYALAKSAEEILLKDILDALGEPAFSSSHCAKHGGDFDVCVHQADCQVRVIWKSFDNLIGRVLENITLADVASGKLGILNSIQMAKSIGETGVVSSKT